jgi:hypothetical protein
MIEEKINLFNEGGLRDDGGETEPTSGNKVPSGSLKEEVADDIPVMMSEGEFVFPADVVRYIGLETLMKMRQDAKQGLKMMEEMGQMGNSEEATIPDDMPFEMADLIVVSGSKPKKMQTGGLLDDPRFKRPEGSGGVPTITAEDRKVMEDALLRTGYGNVVMKRYVNANGDVKYIPFVNGEPQMEIPEGYELDESAPKTESNIGGSGDSGGGGGDSGGPASPAPAFGDGMTFEKPRGPMVDGVEYKNLQEMSADALIKYYKQFDSPIYRYAATGAALFFSPLAGLAIMAGQTLSNKNSPTGLNAVQEELKKRKLTATQRKSVLTIAESLRKNGAGGIGTVGKKLLQTIGVLSNTEQGEELTDFEKAIKSGNTADAVSAAGKAVSNKQPVFNKAVLNKALTEKEFMFDYGYEGDPFDLDPEKFVFDYGAVDQDFGASGYADEFGPAEPINRTDFAKIAEGYADEFGSSSLTEPIIQQEGDRRTDTGEDGSPEEYDGLTVPSVDGGASTEETEEEKKKREERLGRRLPSTQFVDDYGFDKDATRRARKKYTKDTRTIGQRLAARLKGEDERFGIKTDERIKVSPAYTPTYDPNDERRTAADFYGLPQQQDDDRDDGGPSSGIDDFFGSDFGQSSQQTAKTDTYTNLTGSPFGDRGRSQTSSYSAPSNTPDFAAFYVGGVPTKPMKPQRLKKGGLAKPKVKPKRMKKGGLASSRKK